MRKYHHIENVRIESAEDKKSLAIIDALAGEIWREHYTPIIGKEQVAYMLDKFQSLAAMEKQLANGMAYYLVYFGTTPCGYLGIERRGEALFLSKIYLLRYFRGRGLGNRMMSFVEERALELGCDRIQLTVNRHNSTAIKAYEKMGFRNLRPIVADIGEGFVMDDFLLEKRLVQGFGNQNY